MMRPVAPLLLTVAACIGDPTGRLTADAALPRPVAGDCLRATLARLEGVDSVHISLQPPPTGDASQQAHDSITYYDLFPAPEQPVVSAIVHPDRTTNLQVVWGWLGSRPDERTVQRWQRQGGAILDTVAVACGFARPAVRVTKTW